MKLEPFSKLEKRNTMMLKNFNDNVMFANYVIFNFEIYSQSGAVGKLDSECMARYF